MKKLLFIFLLFISFAAWAQPTPLPQSPSAAVFGFLDVRAYGAVGDSTTDNTAAFRKCFADAGRLHTGVWIPSGNWVISDSIIILERVNIQGAGGSVNNNDELGSGGLNPNGEVAFGMTNILQRGNSKSVFVVDPVDTGSKALFNTGSSINNLAILYQGTTPTAGAGVRMIDGGSYNMYGVSITGFWIDMDVQASSYPSLVACRFSNYANIGMRIRNSLSPDWGGTMMVNCMINTGQYTSPYAGLVWLGSGAFRMSNCEFNVTGLGNIMAKYCLVLQNLVDGPTQEIYINNTSLSGFDSCALKADSMASLTNKIIISNIVCYGPINDSAYRAPMIFGTPVGGSISNLVISNVTGASNIQNKAGTVIPMIDISRCNFCHVSNISNGQYYTGPAVAWHNCQSGGYTYDNPITTTGQDANGFQQILTLAAPGEIDITANNGASGLGPNPLVFRSGTATITGQMLGNGQWVFGLGNPISLISTYPFVHAEKDTAADISLNILNTSSNAAAGAGFAVKSDVTAGRFRATSTNFAGYKNILANTIAVYAAGNLSLLADGGAWDAGNINGSLLHIAATGVNFGIGVGSSPNSQLDVGQIAFAQNGAAGNIVSIRGVLLGNSTTGSGGTVAEYSFTGFGAPQGSASNTSVTYTSSATVYIAGPPTASTNVTITHAWPLKIGAGTIETAASTTSAASINFPSGSTPSSPANGDFWYDGTHAEMQLAGVTTALDANIYNSDGTLTANRIVTVGVHNLTLNGGGVFIQQNTAGTFNYGSLVGPAAGTSHWGMGYISGGAFSHGLLDLDSTMNFTVPANFTVTGNQTFTSTSTFTMPIGSIIKVTEGSGGRVGQIALTSGTKAITIAGVTSSSRAFVTLVSQSGTTTTTQSYIAVCTTNTLTVSAVTAAGSNTVNTTDGSTFNYFIVN